LFLTQKRNAILAKLQQPQKVHCGQMNDAWMQKRVACLNAQLARPNLPAQKIQDLTQRRDVFLVKLAQQKSTEPASPVNDQPKSGPCDKTSKIQTRLAWIDAKLAEPNLPANKIEMLNLKKQRLTAKLDPKTEDARPRGAWIEKRLAAIDAKLQESDLPIQKREALERQKSMFQAKLIQAQTNQEIPHPECSEPQCPRFEDRQCPRQCPRLEARLAMINSKLEQPGLSQQKIEMLTQKRVMIQTKLSQQQNGNSNENVNVKTRLEDRLAFINSKLEQPGLSQQKIDMLTRKREMIQTKLSQNQNCQTPMPRGGYLERRLSCVVSKMEQPNISPEKLAILLKKKQMLEAKIAQTSESVDVQRDGPEPRGCRARFAVVRRK